MRLRPILPYALIVLLAGAALAAAPAVVAAREGGMGLGSALIAAQVLAVAGITLGATLVVGLGGGGGLRIALAGGALVLYVGFTALGMQPMGALGWTVAALGLAGVGNGILLTVAFVAAARMEARSRPAAVAVLLVASLAATVLAPLLASLGGLSLTLAAGTVVAVTVVVARVAATGAGPTPPDEAVAQQAAGPAWTTIASGAVVSIGVVLVLAAADPSRVTAITLAGAIGLAGLEGLDPLRAAMALIGMLLVGGSSAAWALRNVGGPARAGASGLWLASLATAGTLAMTSVPGPPTGGVPPAVVAASASLVAIPVAGWWLTRGADERLVAVSGTAIVLAGVAIALLARGGAFAASPDPGGTLAAAVVAVGGAVAFVALRVVLASVAVAERVAGAAAGIGAVAFGTLLGTMLGAGARAGWAGSVSDSASPIGLVLLGAAILAVLAAWWLPRRVVASAR